MKTCAHGCLTILAMLAGGCAGAPPSHGAPPYRAPPSHNATVTLAGSTPRFGEIQCPGPGVAEETFCASITRERHMPHCSGPMPAEIEICVCHECTSDADCRRGPGGRCMHAELVQRCVYPGDPCHPDVCPARRHCTWEQDRMYCDPAINCPCGYDRFPDGGVDCRPIPP